MSKYAFENPYGTSHEWTAIHEEDTGRVRLLDPNNHLRGIIHVDEQPPVVEGSIKSIISEEVVSAIAAQALGDIQPPLAA